MPEYVLGKKPRKKITPFIDCEFFVISHSRHRLYWTIRGQFVGLNGSKRKIYIEDLLDESYILIHLIHPDRFCFKFKAHPSNVEAEFREAVSRMGVSPSHYEFILDRPLTELLNLLKTFHEMDVEKVYMGERIKPDRCFEIKADFRPFVSKYRYIDRTRNDSKPTFYAFVLGHRKPGDQVMEVKVRGSWQNRCEFVLLIGPDEADQFQLDIKLCMRDMVQNALSS